MIPRPAVTAAFLAFMLAAAHNADACSCVPSGPPCQGFFEAHSVFTGTVRSLTPTGFDATRGDSVRVDFDDVIPFRGVDGTTQSVFTAAHGAACGFAFEPGERYVVYAHRQDPGASLQVSTCSRTRRISDAAEDLLFFRSLPSTSSTSRVFGTITQRELNLVEGKLLEYGPVANVRLTLRSDEAVFQASTDTEGRYELQGIPPALYQLTAEPPSQFSTDGLSRKIRLNDWRACAEVNFELRFDGRVRGLIRGPTGDPVINARVQMMPIEHMDTKGVPETIDVTTDATGRFEFTQVFPGRYVVGVDLFGVSASFSDPPIVFPATYHPGTRDALRATIIDVRGGERHDLAPMTLPPPRRSDQLTGTVILQDGTPAVGVTVVLLDAARKWFDVAPPVNTDTNGAFSFVVHEGLSYIASAAYRGRDAQGQRQPSTTIGPFVVTPDLLPLRIVLTTSR